MGSPTRTPAATDRSESGPSSLAAAQRLTALSSLLEGLDEVQPADTSRRARQESQHQNRLVQVRLGLASSLYASLRAKHPPTAAHSLRVAIGCSSWMLTLDLPDKQRDEIEVAALLHDIGKIGVPDEILRKPGKLSPEEAELVDRHRAIGREILGACCACQEILETIAHVAAWYNGSKAGFSKSRDEIPIGSRLIAIVDAFDAMTTDRVYRRAMSRERALAELFEYAGTQFDPQLARGFAQLLASDQGRLNSAVATRWLRQLQPETSNHFWQLQEQPGMGGIPAGSLYHEKLLDNMLDGVVFVDGGLKILHWNLSAERLTGISGTSVVDKQWSPTIVDLQDEHHQRISDEDCPLAEAVRGGVQTMRRLHIRGRGGHKLSVDAHLIPVTDRDGTRHGATLLLHDASSEITLEERVQTLHHKATRDPLTQVANRAEFDRFHRQFVETHLEQSLPCSLIICDIDHFKRINDTYGHQAGDEALVSFAAMLRRHTRSGDLVARYGGEEFVLLCAGCDNATATTRAEQVRRELATTPQGMLNGQCITASFGVTELQAGDTAETMLRRADRALLSAKDTGRNRVVQLGSGGGPENGDKPRTSWLAWLQPTVAAEELLDLQLMTAVPLNIAAEKLKGFVSDHHANIESISENRIALLIDSNPAQTRRAEDRPVPFCVELAFDESQGRVEGRSESTALRTLIHVKIRPKRSRDRRRSDALERARKLLASLKSYLMASDCAQATAEPEQEPKGLLQRAARLLVGKPPEERS